MDRKRRDIYQEFSALTRKYSGVLLNYHWTLSSYQKSAVWLKGFFDLAIYTIRLLWKAVGKNVNTTKPGAYKDMGHWMWDLFTHV